MEKEKELSEKESLRLITEMIQQAKAGYYHDSGVGAILWGTVVSFAGFMNFLQLHFNWQMKFDWWLLALVAIIPQVILIRKEKKEMVVKTHVGKALDTVWVIFGISIFAIILYINMAPVLAGKFLEESGFELLKRDINTGVVIPYEFKWAFSPGSLFLIIYALPTIVTGIVQKFKPMIIGACITYIFFVVSIFTQNPIDQLLLGISGIVNWLIPGLILHKNYAKARNHTHV